MRPQLFGDEPAQGSDERHLLGVEILEVDFLGEMLARRHHHLDEGQGIERPRQQQVVVVGKPSQRTLPAVPQLAVEKVSEKRSDVVPGRAVHWQSSNRTVHWLSSKMAGRAWRSNLPLALRGSRLWKCHLLGTM